MTPEQLAQAKKAMALQDQVAETARQLKQKYVEASGVDIYDLLDKR